MVDAQKCCEHHVIGICCRRPRRTIAISKAGARFLRALSRVLRPQVFPRGPARYICVFPKRGAQSGSSGLPVREMQQVANSHGAIGVPPADVHMPRFQNIAKTHEITAFSPMGERSCVLTPVSPLLLRDVPSWRSTPLWSPPLGGPCGFKMLLKPLENQQFRCDPPQNQ